MRALAGNTCWGWYSRLDSKDFQRPAEILLCKARCRVYRHDTFRRIACQLFGAILKRNRIHHIYIAVAGQPRADGIAFCLRGIRYGIGIGFIKPLA